ncbi:MAG: hypothetical protein ABJB01_12320 [Rudaea sp.]
MWWAQQRRQIESKEACSSNDFFPHAEKVLTVFLDPIERRTKFPRWRCNSIYLHRRDLDGASITITKLNMNMRRTMVTRINADPAVSKLLQLGHLV